MSHNHRSPDRHEHVQPPSYNEATERISIFIDAYALQAIQESGGNFSEEFLEKIRAAQRDQYHFQSMPSCTQHQRSLSTPLVQTTRRPLPPLPRTRTENVEAGYAHHHCGSYTLPMHQITPDQMAVTPSQITGRSETGGGYGDPRLPKDENSNLVASTYTKIPVPGRSEAAACTQAPANPDHRIGAILPPHSSGTAEESLHIDELNVAERKPLSKMEKALLRRVEFGSKVDNSILQLCSDVT